jgi:hypothetical protein
MVMKHCVEMNERRSVGGRYTVFAGTWVSLCLCALVNLGCTAILGVEDAECDPDFDDACGEQEVVTEAGSTTEEQETTAPPEEEPDAATAAQLLSEACTEYCEIVIDACADVEQFKTATGCQTVCEGMYHLADGDGAGENSVQCHMHAADNALNFSDGVEDNCVSAGPMGLSCGGACNNYCEQIERYCPEEFEKMDNCADECRDVPRADVPYTDGFPAGNTLECRVYHVQLAVLQQPNRLVHCGHAVGNSLCADE